MHTAWKKANIDTQKLLIRKIASQMPHDTALCLNQNMY